MPLLFSMYVWWAVISLHSCGLGLEDGDVFDGLERGHASGAHARGYLTIRRVGDIPRCEHTGYACSARAWLSDDVAIAVKLHLAVEEPGGRHAASSKEKPFHLEMQSVAIHTT